jgi:hypothetical protein
MRQTVNFTDQAFRESVAEWLGQVAAEPRLRELSFLVAAGAATTCEDRVTLTWNAMQTARLTTDVEKGEYDRRLPELIPLARSMFRLNALEKIARQKAKALEDALPPNSTHEVDEIEVYLALQVKLREQLALPFATQDMRWFKFAELTPEDLQAAEKQVLAEEAEQFVDFLSTEWQPWEAVVQQLDKAAHQDTQDELIDALDGEFQIRLERRLAQENLSGDPDAERIAGAQITAELAREIKGRLTHKVLADRGLAGLLDPPVIAERRESPGVVETGRPLGEGPPEAR